MVKLLLTLNHIPEELYKNYESFYKCNYKIPINCNYLLYKMPYYKNSQYYFRDITSKADFDLLKSNTFNSKPTSNKSYNMGKFYIPGKDKGICIKYEILPKEVSKFNVIDKNFYIEKINFYSNTSHKYDPIITIDDNLSNTVIKKIECIATNIEKIYEFYKYEYTPRQKILISCIEEFSINLSDFELNHIISDNYMKKYFNIFCNLV